jgi:hypothetical protein
MKRTRIVVGLSVAIAATFPLIGLAHLSREIRYVDFFNKIFRHTDLEFPLLSSIMLPFGPLDWWGYVTPLALAIAAAASLRSPLPTLGLVSILLSSIIQSLVMVAVAEPYFYVTKVMGNFPTTPYPTGPLVANLSLVALSVGLACVSLWRLILNDRSHKAQKVRRNAEGCL